VRLGEEEGRCENTLQALRHEHAYSTYIDTRMKALREKEICRRKSTGTESTPQIKKKILYQRRPYEAWFPLYGLLIKEYFQCPRQVPCKHCRRQTSGTRFSSTTYVMINTNIFINFLFINYCSDMFRSQFLTIFRELFVSSMFAAYVSTYLAAFYIMLLKLIYIFHFNYDFSDI